MKRVPSICLFAALAGWSGAAGAQAAEAFSAGTFALSGERLTGFYHANVSLAGAADSRTNRITLLGESSSGPYDLPRVGIDGFVIDHLSLGGTLMIAHSDTTDRAGVLAGFGAVSANATVTDVFILPRVGYAVMFSQHVGIWPRGGFSYFHRSVAFDRGGTTSIHYFALNLEAPFLFAVAPGFAITVGPTIDVALDGSVTNAPGNGGPFATSTNTSFTAFGIASGLTGWF
jgi:hypothetical protein